MSALIKIFVAIAVRRCGPEDLPDSGFLLGLTALGYIAVQLPVAWIYLGGLGYMLQTVATDIALLMACLWLLLWLTGYRSRYRQTLTALMGTGALLTALSLPFNVWRQAVSEVEQAAALPSAFILAIVIWTFVIDGHILSRALSRPFAIGLMVAVAYFFVHTTVLFEIVPSPE